MAYRKLAIVRGSQPVTCLDTQLNSLAAGASALSNAIENGTELDLYADWELNVTFGTGPTANSRIELWLARTLDGTNYEDATGANPSVIIPQNGFIGSWIVRSVTTAQRLIIPHPAHILLPPENFKLLVVNKTNQAFPASGSTVLGLFYREQIA